MILPFEALPVTPIFRPRIRREEIILPGNGVTNTDTAKSLYSKIAGAPESEVYCKDRKVVRLITNDEGECEVVPLTPDQARSYFERFGEIKVYRRGQGEGLNVVPTVMNDTTAKVLLVSDEAEKHLPSLRGIVKTPFPQLIEGRLTMLEPGYNREPGIYVSRNLEMESVELDEAVDALKGLIDEIEFQRPGDRSRALAALLTPGLKRAGIINSPAPIHVLLADQPQAGKGFFISIQAALYGEEARIISRQRGGVGSCDEALANQIYLGANFIHIDNLRGSFESEYVESFMTTRSKVNARIPHLGYVDVDISQTTFSISSNGLEMTPDLARRANPVNILKREDHQYQDIPKMISERQGFYLGCIFSILGAYVDQEMPRTEDTRHSFHDWAQINDWIVQNLFGEAALLDELEDTLAAMTNPSLSFLRSVAIAVRQDGRLDERLTASDIAEVCYGANIRIAKSKDNSDLVEGVASRTVGIRLKPLFRDRAVVHVDRCIVERGTQELTGTSQAQFFYIFRTDCE